MQITLLTCKYPAVRFALYVQITDLYITGLETQLWLAVVGWSRRERRAKRRYYITDVLWRKGIRAFSLFTPNDAVWADSSDSTFCLLETNTSLWLCRRGLRQRARDSEATVTHHPVRGATETTPNATKTTPNATKNGTGRKIGLGLRSIPFVATVWKRIVPGYSKPNVSHIIDPNPNN